MKTISKYLTSLVLFSSMLLLAGCSEESSILTPGKTQDGNGDVILSLNVSIANSQAATRGFEPTKNPLEKIHSLRIIIVNAKDTVEHNLRVDMPEGIGVDKVGELEFKVSTKYGIISEENPNIQTEKKRIYLIANEDAIPNGVDLPKGMVDIRKELNENIKPGTNFLQSSAKYIVIWNNWIGTSENAPTLPEYATPFIDNEGENKKYVLMSEFFDVDVTSNLTIAGEQRTDANLFITRNLVKFRFTIKADDVTPSFRVKKIVFSNLMQKEYLFPNEAVYDPAKYDADGKVSIADREIVSFDTPSYLHGDGNYVRPFIFEPANFGFNASSSTSFTSIYEPNLYFCETKNLVKSGDDDTVTDSQLYTVGIEVEFLNKLKDDADGNEVWDPFVVNFDAKQLENLLLLPRNTIVQVDMVVHNGVLDATATVFPYTAVNLNPEFGSSTPVTDRLTVAPTAQVALNSITRPVLHATYTSEAGTKPDIVWVSSNPSVLLLGPEHNEEDPESQLYIKPHDSIVLPLDEGVIIFPQSVGTTDVTAYSQTGLVARCRVTVTAN